MSTLYVDDVAGQGGGTATSLMDGLLKVRATYDQTGPTTEETFNVTSITDVNTGDFTVNFTSNMGNATYQLLATAGGGVNVFIIGRSVGVDKTAALIDVQVESNAGTDQDAESIMLACAGELA